MPSVWRDRATTVSIVAGMGRAARRPAVSYSSAMRPTRTPARPCREDGRDRSPSERSPCRKQRWRRHGRGAPPVTITSSPSQVFAGPPRCARPSSSAPTPLPSAARRRASARCPVPQGCVCHSASVSPPASSGRPAAPCPRRHLERGDLRPRRCARGRSSPAGRLRCSSWPHRDPPQDVEWCHTDAGLHVARSRRPPRLEAADRLLFDVAAARRGAGTGCAGTRPARADLAIVLARGPPGGMARRAARPADPADQAAAGWAACTGPDVQGPTYRARRTGPDVQGPTYRAEGP